MAIVAVLNCRKSFLSTALSLSDIAMLIQYVSKSAFQASYDSASRFCRSTAVGPTNPVEINLDLTFGGRKPTKRSLISPLHIPGNRHQSMQDKQSGKRVQMRW